jgi:hypothetical protein
MDWLYYNTLCEECARKNHGVLSALMLCYRMAVKEGFLSKVANGDAQTENFFRLHLAASHAISLHNKMDSIRIRFNEHPFAYLLVLCDEIQDWGRDKESLEYDKAYLSDIRIKKNEKSSRIYIEMENELGVVRTIYKRLQQPDLFRVSINDWDIDDTVEEIRKRRRYANAIMKGLEKLPDNQSEKNPPK